MNDFTRQPWVVPAVRTVNSFVLAMAVAMGLFLRFAPPVSDNPATPHWATGSRDVTVVDRTGDPGWWDATRWAVDRWNEAGADIHLRWDRDTTGDCTAETRRIEVCKTSYMSLNKDFNLGFQGLLSPDDSGAHRHSAEIVVCSDCDLDKARRRLVATHEIGHALGLAHSSRTDSIMYHSGGAARPSAADLADLRAVYDHVDSPPPCGTLHVHLGSLCL